MRDDLLKAQHYRNQAAHLRELAATEGNDEIRRALSSLAENYNDLCLTSLHRAEKTEQEWPDASNGRRGRADAGCAVGDGGPEAARIR